MNYKMATLIRREWDTTSTSPKIFLKIRITRKRRTRNRRTSTRRIETRKKTEEKRNGRERKKIKEASKKRR